jgi:diguanylate cyclase (GGDEF)-like protein
MRALIVAPAGESTRVASQRLHDVGCTEVVVAATSDEAMATARARRQDLDLVLLDLELADSDALVVCRRLASLLGGVPIVACSTRATDDAMKLAYEAGAHDFVAKPFADHTLDLRARAALRIREERVKRDQREGRLADWANQLERAKRQLESAVVIDPLTGVGNRRHFDTLLAAEWRRAARVGATVSLVLFDIDNFHAFNEHYGHIGGDACLARVATTLAHGLRRASDVIARYGGEEFVAVLADTDAHGACVVAERLRAHVEAMQIPHAGSEPTKLLTLSAGVATKSATVDSPARLVAAADAALYRAKHDGRNRCRADGLDANRVEIVRMPWPRCPVVVLDPVLVQRVPSFLEETHAELATLRDADHAGLRTALSRIERAGSALGFEDLVGLVTEVEGSSGRGDRDAVLAAVDKLAWYVTHVQVVYRKTLAVAAAD